MSSKKTQDALAGLSLEQKRELVARLARRKSQRGTEPAPTTQKPPARPAGRRLPASFAQARLWFLDRLAPGESAYNNFLALDLRGPLQSHALEAAVDALERRHESLRTTFQLMDGEPQQVVAPPRSSSLLRRLPVVDLTAVPTPARETIGAELLRRACADPFDLARGLEGGLLRTLEVRLAPRHARVALSLHHTVSDEWSLGILGRELARLYDAGQRAGESPTGGADKLASLLPPLPIQYGDYAQWQRRRLGGERRQQLLEHWRHRLGDPPPPLELPLDHPRPPVENGAGAVVGRMLSPALRHRLETLGRGRGASLFMTVTAALATLLGRLTGQTDLCLGTPFANRDRSEVQDMVGLLINTLVLRHQLDPAASFTAAIDAARDEVLAATAHQELPFEVLVAELAGRRDLAQSPFFQVMVVLQAEDTSSGPLLPGLETSLLPVGEAGSVFDWTFILRETPDGLWTVVEHRTELFDATTVARALASLETLLEAAVTAPDTPLRVLPLMSPGARHQALVEWGRGASGLPLVDLPELILARAAEAPDAVALDGPDGPMTYAELARRSAALAVALRARLTGPEPVVGLFLDRCQELPLAMLAVLRGGAAFVPLDPALPAPRLRYLAEASGAGAVLTTAGLAPQLPTGLKAPILELADLESEGHGRDDGAAEQAARPHPESLAYVIFTSGSTGQPKGAAVPRHSFSRFAVMVARSLGLGPRDRVLQLASPGFDVILQEVFPTWCAGGTVIVPRVDLGDIRELDRAVERWRVSAVELPAALWQQWLAHLEATDRPASSSLRLAVVGGEAVRRALLPRWLDRCPRLVHVFGLTETTCTNMFENFSAGDRPRGLFALPLGLPEEDNDLFVLDGRLRPVAPGSVGDLYIGGPLVARGYHGQPRRTAERFLPNPYGAPYGDLEGGVPGTRLYRTGDRARRLADGRSEFLGRADTQLKVRGFRIEPGEVEEALMALATVTLAAVDARGEGDRRSLVAWYQPVPEPPEGAGAGAPAAIREALTATLPPWMVPTLLVPLESMPISPNGKVDRHRLPDPWEAAADEVGSGSGPARPPSTALEEQLLKLWNDVLGRSVPGVDRDFFTLGGHSLLAVRLLTRVQEELAVEVPLRALFEGPTVAALARRIEALRATALRHGDGADAASAPPERVDRRGPLPLSFAQEHLWVLHQLEGTGAAYSLPFTLGLRGPLKPAALAAALDALTRRHEILRTTLTLEAMATEDAPENEPGGHSAVAPMPRQRIAPPASVPLPVVDLRGLPPEPRRRVADALLGAAANRSFDLSRGPLLRALLLRLGGPREGATGPSLHHALSLDLHHAVCDEWSLGILVRELGTAYEAAAAAAARRRRSAAVAALVPALEYQYVDYAAWQRRRLSGDRRRALVEHWREALAELEPLDLPFDRPRPPLQTFRGAAVGISLDPATTAALEALAARQGGTLFMVLLAAFHAQLGQLAQRRDVALGSPLAGRGRPEWQGLIGYFVNMLVLRGDLGGDPSFEELVERSRSRVVAALDHGELPFEGLVEELAPRRDLARNPLFQVAFQLDAEAPPEPRAGELELETRAAGETWAKFDLTLSLETRGTGTAALGREAGPGTTLGGALVYNLDLFDASTATRWARSLEAALTAVARDPRLPLSRLPWISAAQRHQMLAEWNAAGATETFRSVPGRLAALARHHALRPAVEAGDETWSYGELLARAGAQGAALAAAGVGPGDLVAVALPRSPRWVAALVAILDLGAAYLPLDLSQPPQRLQDIVDDARCRAAVVDRVPGAAGDAGDTWHPAGTPLVEVPASAPTAPLGDPGPTVDADAKTDADALAYVIYTSGSTGRPKGVEVRHGGLAALVDWHLRRYRVTSADRASHLAGLGFDASVWELWPYLAAGAAVVLAPETVRRDPRRLGPWLEQQRVSLAFLPTPLAEELLRERAHPGPRVLLTGGDRLVRRPPVGAPWELMNHYGPTENSVVATAGPVPPGVASAIAPDIGRPIDGTRVYLLGQDGRPVPPGSPGELCLAGAGLARGYRRRPARTADAFRPDPSSFLPGARLYRTGDLGRWRADGRIDFLGRRDHQVQLRGLRLELGEVEAVLSACPEVRAAVAQLWAPEGGGEERLVAWLVAADGIDGELARQAAEAAAEGRLPAVAVPAAWVALEQLPMTPNGKVDRRALPAPSGGGPRRAPETPVQRQLAQLWQQMLGVESVALEDGFFALGGHSLAAVRLASAVRADLGVELELAAIFEARDLEQLARRVEAAAAAAAAAPGPALQLVPRDQPLPLSYAQQRLWLLDELMPGSPLYNVPLTLDLAAPTDAAGGVAATLSQALSAVVARHEVLRTVFPADDGAARQHILPPASVPLPTVDLSGLPAAPGRRATAAVTSTWMLAPFDLARGPLLRALLLDLGPGQAAAGERHLRLVICLHHIVCDAWSLGILVRETAAALAALATDSHSQSSSWPPPSLPVQYADYAVWQRRWLGETEARERQLEWWRQRLAGAPGLAQLPVDRPRPPLASHRGAEVRRTLPAPWHQRLTERARSHDTTPFLVALTLFAAFMGRVTGQRDLVVGTPVANRQRRELEDLVGFFLNTLPLRLEAPGDALDRALERLPAHAAEAFSHQDLPFEQLVEELVPERHRSHTPLFQVLFVYEPGEGGTDVSSGDDALAVAPPSLDPATWAPPGLRMLTPREISAASASTTATPSGTGTAKFELTAALRQVGGAGGARWELGLEYATDLFDATTAARLAGALERLMMAALADPAAPLETLPLTSAAQRHQLVTEWNAVPPVFATEDPSLPALAAAEARRHRHRSALLWPREGEPSAVFTYGQVHRWSAALARRLTALGAGPERKVALLLPRGPEMVAAVQGVLASGAACLPLDAAYPDDRLAFVLEDSAPTVVLTEEALAPRLSAVLATVPASAGSGAPARVCLEELPPLASPDNPDEPLPLLPVEERDVGPDALYYVIYTSGSTGRPKGIELAHGAMTNLLAWHRDTLLGGARTLQLASLGFDASFHEIYAAWTTGGTLVGVPEELRRDAAGLGELLRREAVEKAILPVVLLHALAQEQAAGRPLAPSLLELTTTGEQLRITDAVVELFAQLPGLPLHNHYGPSESHVVSAWTLGGAAAPPERRDPRRWPSHPSIGRPLPSTGLHVVDRHLRPQLLGVTGELMIGGICLARGYQGRPALTAERFVPDPLGLPGERLYRTGDLARWRRDGALEYLGRRDDQVKIRGFRVEPGEVEAALAAHPAVDQAVVTVFDGPGGRALAAWATPADAAPSVDELRAHLQSTLPEHMVPAAIRVLDAFPLNANGKVDRRALPAPELAAEVSSAAAVTAAQRVVAAVLGQALESATTSGHVPGLDDDFFALGGHSLVATRVISRLRRIFRLDDLPLGVLFDHPTVAGVVAELEQRWGGRGSLEAVAQSWLTSGPPAPEPGPEGEERLEQHGEDLARRGLAPRPTPPPTATGEAGPHPLSFAQERLYFLARLAPESPAYNVASGARLRGPLQPRALALALAAVRARHGALRTTFRDTADGPLQVVPPAVEAPSLTVVAAALPMVDFSALAARSGDLAEASARQLAEAAARRPFDLSRGPLARFLLLRLGSDAEGQRHHALVACLHHIISDGWTQGLLLEELGRAYGAATHDAAPLTALGSRPLNYHDIARWQRRWLEGDELDRQLTFWLRRIERAPAALELPADHPRPPFQSFRGAAAPIFLDSDLTADLSALARSRGATLFMVALAAFGALLHRLSWQRRVVVGCPVANRPRPELERVAGFFVNTLPLVVDCGPEAAEAADEEGTSESLEALSFDALLERVRRMTLEAQAHQDLPFERLVHEQRRAGGARDASRNPIFQVLFQLAPEALVAPAPLPGLDTESFPFDDSGTKFDLALSLMEDARGVSGLLRYASDLFDAATVETWGRQLVELLRGAVADPSVSILELGAEESSDPAAVASGAGEQAKEAGSDGAGSDSAGSDSADLDDSNFDDFSFDDFSFGASDSEGEPPR